MPNVNHRRAAGRDITQDIGQAIGGLERTINRWSDEDMHLLSFTVSTPLKGRADYLIVARFTDGTSKKVAFSSGDTVYDALRTFANRMANKQLKLREDEYG